MARKRRRKDRDKGGDRDTRRARRRQRRAASEVTARGRPVTATTTEPAAPAPGALNLDGTAVYSTGPGPVMAYQYGSDGGGYPQQYATAMDSESGEVSPV